MDAVCWLPDDLGSIIWLRCRKRSRLYEMLATRCPAELFGVFGRERWEEWTAFFSQTRETDGWRKGLVEVSL